MAGVGAGDCSERSNPRPGWGLQITPNTWGVGYGGSRARLGSYRPVCERMRSKGRLGAGHIFIYSVWDGTLSDLEASASFSKWYLVSCAVVRCSENSVLFSGSQGAPEQRRYQGPGLSVSKQTPWETFWLLLSRRISNNLQKHGRTLWRVSSWHWSQPTAGLQEKCKPLIQDQNKIFNSSQESTVAVWHLWQGDIV